MAERKEIVIHEINGLTSFVKIKGDSMPIGKILFSFVNFDKESKKSSGHIDCYMNIGDALVLSEQILNGKLMDIAKKGFKPEEQYQQPFWNSTLGGVSEEKAKERGLRTDGKAVSRSFNLCIGAKKADSSRNPFIITATQKPGKTNDRGLIVPERGAKAEITVRVPVSDKDELMRMALLIKSHVSAYFSSLY